MESLRVEIEKVWWQQLLKMLQDSFIITPKASLPTKEKEALKKAFGGFNTGFEQVFCSCCDENVDCGRVDVDDDDDDATTFKVASAFGIFRTCNGCHDKSITRFQYVFQNCSPTFDAGLCRAQADDHSVVGAAI